MFNFLGCGSFSASSAIDSSAIDDSKQSSAFRKPQMGRRGLSMWTRTVASCLTLLAFAAWPSTLMAQSAQYIPAIGNVTSGTSGFAGDNGPASAAALSHPTDVAFDKSGDMFIADSVNNAIRRIDATTGIITTVAGTGSATVGYAGDGGQATLATLDDPTGVAVDSNGNIYIADTGNNRVRMVYESGTQQACLIELENQTLFGLSGTATSCAAATSAPVAGYIYTVSGTGVAGTTNDNSNDLAGTAELNYPSSLAIDSSNNLYIASAHASLVLKVTLSTGVASRYAGTGTGGFTGDGTTANSAKMNNCYGIALDASGNMYISDTKNYVIRFVNASTQIISTVVGTVTGTVPTAEVGTAGTAGQANGNGGQALSAKLVYVQRLTVDRNGNVLLSDANGEQIRSFNPKTGIITALAGNGTAGSVLGAAINAELNSPLGLAADPSNNIDIADADNNVIRKVNASADPAFAGINVGATGELQSFYTLLNQALTVQSFQTPTGFADFTTGTMTGCALNSSNSADSVCAAPITFAPHGPGLRTAPLTLTDGNNIRYMIGLTGTSNAPQIAFAPGNASTAAGNGTVGYSGDSGSPTAAELDNPAASVVDGSGAVYIADAANNVIRKIQNGVITTIAGNGTAGFGGDGAVAAASQLSNPTGLALDAVGDLFIADAGNNRIREISAQSGLISTVAGDGTSGFSGDTAAATSAELMGPNGVAVDTFGNLYIADTGNSRVRMVTAATGIITTIAGDGTQGFTGDGAAATAAELYGPTALALDQSGDLYIADTSNAAIRKVVLSTGVISTVAGKGTAGYTGDNGPATSATLSSPSGIAVDAANNLYIADTGNSGIRLVLSSAGTISTIAGNGTAAYAGDGGGALTASFDQPKGVTLDYTGRLYVTDTLNNRVRLVDTTTSSLAFGTVNPAASSVPVTAVAMNIGNQPLTLSQLSIAASFTQQPSGGTDCTATTTLSPGQSCNVELIFQPQSTGTYTGTISFTDNSLNQTAGTQTVQLGGLSSETPTGLTVTGLSTSVTAGSAQNITVSPFHGSSIVTSYTGTVQFSSTDPQAVLPASYTYTSADAGTHVFPVTFGTAGAQSITVVDTQNANIAGSESTTVAAAAAASLKVVSGNGQTAQLQGAFPVAFDVQVVDAYGNGVSGVTVTFSAPTSGTSGTFTGTATTAQSVTNASGNAIAPTFTANSIDGSYTVTATAPGLTAVSFSLTNSGSVVPTIALTLSPAGSTLIYGQSVTLTATLAPSTVNSVAATGTVTFYDNCSTQGPLAIGTATIKSGAASFTDAVPSTCVHSFTATYSGDSNFSSNSTTTAVPLTVGQATATLTPPAQSPVTITAGQSGQINVAIAGQFSGTNIVPPTGSLTYQIGTAGTPESAPIALGQTTLSIPNTLAGGPYTIAVTYPGDDNYQAASLNIPLSITLVTQTITFAPIGNQTFSNAPVTLSATASSGLPVTYKVDSGPGAISGSTLTILGGGSITVEADQSGNSTYSAATPVQQVITVAKVSTQTMLTASATTGNLGVSISLTATVTGIVNGIVPTGAVTFYSGTTLLGTTPLTSSGTATFSTTALPGGQDSVTAQYGGDTNYSASTSSAQSIAIVAPSFNFALASPTFTVTSGQAATTTLTLNATGGYLGTVSFSCTNLPSSASCNFLPASVIFTSTSAQTQSAFVVIQTHAGTVSQLQKPLQSGGSGSLPLSAALVLLPSGILFGVCASKRRRWNIRAGQLWLSGLVVALTMGFLSGCGASNTATNQTGSTTFTVTATDGKTTQSATYTLTIQ